MDEPAKVLDNLRASQPRLLTGYRKISPDPTLVDQVIDHISSLGNPTLYKCESHEFVPNQPLVEKMVDSIPPAVDRTSPIESESQTAQVLVSSNQNELGRNPPISTV